ncbi:MAG: FHA domain-containing protein [Gammaproteobacteria bacterium]|nr:FHA domain-containing protein [Gammaproteobacteria bacterium]
MAFIIQTVDGVVANKFEISDKPLVFGRSPKNQVQIDDMAVSTEHARIFTEQNDEGQVIYILEDLGSTNGTFINEKKIEKQQLRHTDAVRIGWNAFTFIDENEVDLEKTSEIKKSWIPGVYYTKDN